MVQRRKAAYGKSRAHTSSEEAGSSDSVKDHAGSDSNTSENLQEDPGYRRFVELIVQNHRKYLEEWSERARYVINRNNRIRHAALAGRLDIIDEELDKVFTQEESEDGN